ncbi:DMT family transporter [Bacillus sp. DTU_2020_1000418_1_SI_GHA_SEK_038]|uniref:DMT family transporter n=1 Tax=Bacillus sp. DTU_2020_1000418_1_SI_GHA_SEK_038 TaxID=3077585 RepID=UPI0028EB1D3A|nr:DMT family transporter [Bacillus sp. DTU_2020_1000418_1_SI_GHA_SEK_038]WNS76246.1 DMT family transporter [Bacillus sp. DTU_2020_1000418_1_SI_GHA_SEK_038]
MNAKIKMAISMAIFGSIGLFSEKTGLHSIELVFIRCVSASILLGAIWGFSALKTKRKREPIPRREYYLALLCGLFLVINWVFFFRSLEVMSITVAVSIYHLAPVIVLLLGSFLFKEKLTGMGLVFFFICLIGTLLVGGIHQHTSITGFLSTGVLWAFAAALFYALTSITGKGIQLLNPLLTTVIQTSLGILLLLPLVDWSYFTQLTLENWFYILVTGFIHTGFVYYLFFDSLRELRAQTIAILVFVDPVVAILLDVSILSYRPDFFQLLGILLVFIGISYSPKKERSVEKPKFIRTN